MDEFEPHEIEDFDVDALIEDDLEHQRATADLPALEPTDNNTSKKRKYIDDAVDEDVEYAQLEAIEASLAPRHAAAEEKDRKLREERALQCVECEAFAYHVPYYKAFKIAVCNQCQREFPTKYKLITKTTTKTDYMCTESELANLPLMLKANPNEHRTTMKLYRMSDILPLALKRFSIDVPSDDAPDDTTHDGFSAASADQARMTQLEVAISAEKQRRELEKLNRDIAKRQKVRQVALKEERVRAFDVKAALKRNAGHKHEFVSTGGKQKCECGFELEYEEF